MRQVIAGRVLRLRFVRQLCVVRGGFGLFELNHALSSQRGALARRTGNGAVFCPTLALEEDSATVRYYDSDCWTMRLNQSHSSALSANVAFFGFFPKRISAV